MPTHTRIRLSVLVKGDSQPIHSVEWIVDEQALADFENTVKFGMMNQLSAFEFQSADGSKVFVPPTNLAKVVVERLEVIHTPEPQPAPFVQTTPAIAPVEVLHGFADFFDDEAEEGSEDGLYAEPVDVRSKYPDYPKAPRKPVVEQKAERQKFPLRVELLGSGRTAAAPGPALEQATQKWDKPDAEEMRARLVDDVGQRVYPERPSAPPQRRLNDKNDDYEYEETGHFPIPEVEERGRFAPPTSFLESIGLTETPPPPVSVESVERVSTGQTDRVVVRPPVEAQPPRRHGAPQRGRTQTGRRRRDKGEGSAPEGS